MSESTRPSAQTGAPPGASEAALLAQHDRLVFWVVRQQRLGPLPFTDALHEGRIGLWRALRRYDPRRGTAFSTYAVPAIARAVWAAVTREQSVALPLPPPPTTLDQDPVESLHAQALAAAVRAAVAQLPSPLREVVVAHAGFDREAPATFAAIGARLGVSKQRAHQLHVQALAQLAQPAHSLRLRQLTDRLTRADYRATLARQQRPVRARRGGR